MNSAMVDGSEGRGGRSGSEWYDGDLIMAGSSRLTVPKRLFVGSIAENMVCVLCADAGGARDQLERANLL